MDATVICPLMNGEPCVKDGALRKGKLVKCQFWISVMGKHPQSGETINQGGCAITWMPLLMIENSQQQRETGAAIESFRNEMMKANAHLISSRHEQLDSFPEEVRKAIINGTTL